MAFEKPYGDSDGAVRQIVDVLSTISGPSRSILASGHYAAILKVSDSLGIAISTDGVGTKLIIAEQSGRLDTVGIDCVAMNANDIICVGAKPIALVDYLAIEDTAAISLTAIAEGLKVGAQLAEIEIPAGELAVVPEIIRGHPSPRGFDLVGTCIGTVALDAIITGEDCESGDVVIGLPSSGLHANGYTVARRALLEQRGWQLSDTPDELGGLSVCDALLEPTTIYVRAVGALLETVKVHGLAHITGGGLANLLRINSTVGFVIDNPLAVPPIFDLIAATGEVGKKTMWQQFNMGCGFCVVVRAQDADEAVALLATHHPGTQPIGHVTADSPTLTIPSHDVRLR